MPAEAFVNRDGALLYTSAFCKRLLTRSGEVVWDTVVVPRAAIEFGLAPP